jgi:hypothetical protein
MLSPEKRLTTTTIAKIRQPLKVVFYITHPTHAQACRGQVSMILVPVAAQPAKPLE